MGLPLDSRHQAIRRLVRGVYETPEIVSRYLEVGFWPAEEILVLDYMPDEARVVDLGCGAGRTTVALAEIGCRVTGVDISRSMVQTAHQQARCAGVEDLSDFQVMDAMSLAFADNSFDFVLFSYNGIELLPGRTGKQVAFGEIARILRPNGRFVFCAHSPFALNIHMVGRIGAFLRFLLGRVLGFPVREQEVGERFLDEEWEEARYLQILPTASVVRMLRKAGLQLEYLNTRRRIEQERKPGLFLGLEDGERFFVAKKPESSCNDGEFANPVDN